MKPKDLDIALDYDQRRLDVTGKVHDKTPEPGQTEEHDSMSYYHQSYRIVDDNVDLYDLTMAYIDGVATISVPKPVRKKRKKTKIRGANSSTRTNPLLLALQEADDLPAAVRNPAAAELLNHYGHTSGGAAPPRVQPDITLHAPRIAEMNEVDEEFEYWNHKM